MTETELFLGPLDGLKLGWKSNPPKEWVVVTYIGVPQVPAQKAAYHRQKAYLSDDNGGIETVWFYVWDPSPV